MASLRLMSYVLVHSSLSSIVEIGLTEEARVFSCLLLDCAHRHARHAFTSEAHAFRLRSLL